MDVVPERNNDSKLSSRSIVYLSVELKSLNNNKLSTKSISSMPNL
jgi:hypothetical protein